MSNLTVNQMRLPPEQEAIRAKCFHPTGTFVEFPIDDVETSIPARFEKVARMYPERLALQTRNQSLTYQALNQTANQMANALLARRGEKAETVGLLFHTGFALTAAILATLKTGKCYILLNPSIPRARLSFILDNAQCSVVLTDGEYFSLACQLADGRELLNAEMLDAGIDTDNPGIAISPDALASLHYTSGSTGQPKGVVQNHRNLLYLFMTQTNDLHICTRDRFLALMAAQGDTFLALLNGAAVFPINVKQEGLAALSDWMIDQEITVYSSVPSIFRHFVQGLGGENLFPKLRLIRFTGETVYREDVALYRKHFSINCILTNRLSSSEVPAFTRYFVDHSTLIADEIVPVGCAVAGYEILLLGDNGEKVGINEIGEIVVKSRYISPGYWNDSELTQARFAPTSAAGDERIYRTGDLGTMLSDGCLSFVGRSDLQVKVRGNRVEIAEIERALFSLGLFSEAAVVPRPEKGGEFRLAAYLVPKDGAEVNVSSVRLLLSEALPDYMIPSNFVLLDVLPLTSTGKVDRRALPEPGSTRPEINTPYVPPRTALEQELAAIWAEVLSLDRVGALDSFFDLGGHSLAATRIVSQVIKRFRLELPLQSLFQSPTIAEMAAVITEHQARKIAEPELERILAELESISEEKAKQFLADAWRTNSTREPNE
jgi:amino acid adenylation domain-containing protein